MGGVWCKADRGETRPYTTKNNINATISRWTDQVRQAYRKPKTYHRPPRPPQKPLRTHGRLTISHPQLVTEASSDGWRTATLVVPDTAPVPPPRKKRKRNQDLTRTAYSMGDLDLVGSLNNSTISLPDKYTCERGLDSKSSSSTLVVTPVLESRFDHAIDEVDVKQDCDKENIITNTRSLIEVGEEETESANLGDEIIPIEKEIPFSSRILLQSNLGYIDKLSAISEVSTESGFDDKTDIGKSSERSESVTSSDSMCKEPGLNILAHIHNINYVSQLNETNKDIKGKTAISKKEWLQNILTEESEPYFISRDTCKVSRRGSDSLTLGERGSDMSGQPNSLPTDHLHLMNREKETSAADHSVNKTPPPSPEPRINPSTIHETPGTNHSVLLDLLLKNRVAENVSTPTNPFHNKEESIFLTNTKTNIIYKSLSSDKLTDDYGIDYLDMDETKVFKPNPCLDKCGENGLKSDTTNSHCVLELTNPFETSTPRARLSDYSFQTPKLVESDPGLNSLLGEERSNIISSFDFKELTKSHSYESVLKDLPLSGETNSTTLKNNTPGILVNGLHCNSTGSPSSMRKAENKDDKSKLSTREPVSNKGSLSSTSSRRSSLTDSLHEFEMSIYDMLNESKKNRVSSDEEDSLKAVKTQKRQ